jgi:hypothetical protein
VWRAFAQGIGRICDLTSRPLLWVDTMARERRSIVRKLLAGLLLIALGLLVVACGSSPTLLPTGTATATLPASAATAGGSTPSATATAGSTPKASATTAGSTPKASATATAGSTPKASAAAAISSTPPATAAPAVSPAAPPPEAAGTLLLSAGTYVVGAAIPAGAYKGQALSDDSRYRISTDANGKDIVATSPRLTGQFSLKLTKGQYLRVGGVMKITKVK